MASIINGRGSVGIRPSSVSTGPSIVTDGLKLYLDAGNTSSYPGTGTVWTDISGNGNNGTLNGPTGGPPIYNSANGGSIAFDGTDDRVSKVGAIDTGQNFTVSAWINPALLGTTRRTIVFNSNLQVGGRNGWLLSTAAGGLNNNFFITIGQDHAYKRSSTNILSVNTWQYVTAIVTNGGGGIDLYKNGNIITSSGLLTTGTILYTNNEFYLGYRNSIPVSTDYYTGNISNVQIYNRALSASEVLQNYNALKSRYGL